MIFLIEKDKDMETIINFVLKKTVKETQWREVVNNNKKGIIPDVNEKQWHGVYVCMKWQDASVVFSIRLILLLSCLALIKRCSSVCLVLVQSPVQSVEILCVFFL